MSYAIRPATEAEMEQVGLMSAYVYGGSFGDTADNITATSIQPEWTLCAFDGPKLITSFATFPFTVRANGRAMKFAGVTAVGTLPEYRRQGLVRKIMTESIAQQRERGQFLSGLWASQAAIYQRYGYAMAGLNRQYSIDTVDVHFADGQAGDCQVQRLPLSEGLDVAREVYKQFIADRFGYLHRSQVLWRTNVLEAGDDGPVHLALTYRDSQAVGYVAYTLRSDKVGHAARGQEIKIRDLAWLDVDAYRSLWSFLSHHDLVGRISWNNAPLDDPAMLLMREPRMLHCCDTEGSWMRISDVPGALAARGYQGEGSIVISVVGDDFAPWNNGNWQVECAHGEVEVSQVGTAADASMSIGALTGLFTGMFSARQLVNAGQIQAEEPAVQTLEQIFVTRYKPHCPDHY